MFSKMNRFVGVGVGAVLILAILIFIKTRDQGTTYKMEERKLLRYTPGFNQSKQKDTDLDRYLKSPNPYRQVPNADRKFSQAHQDEVVYEILPKEGGFYIEMGAYNGVDLSNTLWLERKHKWTGLLVEANPALCAQIDKVKRSAWRLCACISTEKTVTFIPGNALGGVKDKIDSDHMKSVRNRKDITVPCFTLGRVLDAINVHKIDFYSLDVEGAEMFILGTIKKQLISEEIIVGVWAIEYRVYDGHKNIYPKSKENLAKLRQYFKEVGHYVEHSQLDQFPRSKIIPDGHSLDVVFVNIKIWCETHKVLPDGNKC